MSKFFYSILLVLFFVSISIYARSSPLMDIDSCSVNISPNDTIINSDTALQLQLNASPGAVFYKWTPQSGLSNPNIANPIATVNSSIQYTLEAVFPGVNLISNGDFELGNVGFTTDLNLSLTGPTTRGIYNVVSNANSFEPSFCPCNNGGNYMIIDSPTTPNLIMYSSQAQVEPNTDYVFSLDVATINNDPNQAVGNLVDLNISINNVVVKANLVPAAACCIWTKINLPWNSGNNTTATISIKNNNTWPWGNDFAIDNVLVREVCKAYDTLNITILPATLNPNPCSVYISPNDTILFNPTTPLSIQLNATQGADYYHWSPSTGLSDTIISDPIATINNSIQYVLEAYYVDDENLVYNGDFELGNTGFTTELNLSTNLWPAGNYNIVTAANRYHNLFGTCTNGGKFFVANGASTPNLIVYQTVVNVTPNTDYEFSFEATNVSSSIIQSELSIFQFSVNSQQLGDAFTILPTQCTWTKFHKFWNSGTNTTATITILNQNIAAGGNDFAIDNVALRAVCKAYDTINISLTTSNVDTCTVEIFQNDTTYYTSEPPFFVQLNSSQGADYYNWIPATGLSDPQIFNPIAQITNSIEYVLEACFAGDLNLVYNGDFELGNIGFFTDYLISSAPQIPRGSFKIVSNSNQANYGNTSCTNGGLFFAADASPSVGARVYQSTSLVEPNTDYIFSVDVTATYVETSADYPIMQYAINGEQLGNPITIGAGVCNWITTSKIWNSGNDTTATINIINQNTVGMGNDFAIDNIALRKVCKAYDTINIILSTDTIPTTYLNIAVCENAFPYEYYDTIFNQIGVHNYYFTNNNIVDSIHILTITSSPTYSDTIYEYIYRGDRYRLYGFDEKEDGLYVLVYPSSNGCDSNIYLSLNVIKLMFPNMVSPNGDGINDVFEIHDLFEGGLFLDNELIVYNRQGKIIYTIKNMKIMADFWDPAKTNSPTGTYFYRFIGRSKIKDLDFVGSIEVLR